MKFGIAVLLLIIAVSPFIYVRVLDVTSCVPVRASFFRLQDYQLRRNVIRALNRIRELSPEDHERVCARVERIDIMRFEDQVTRHPEALGLYMPDQRDLTGKGVIRIDRETAQGFMITLEQVLVHEACHAYRVQTEKDFSEAPCEKQAALYTAKRPKESLQQISEEFVSKTGRTTHTYCFEKSRSGSSIKGDCVFINYLNSPLRMCADVFLKRAGARESAQEVCADISPVGHENPRFELLIPPNGGIGDWVFGFSPSNAGQSSP